MSDVRYHTSSIELLMAKQNKGPEAKAYTRDAKAVCVSVKGGNVHDCVNTPEPITALTTGAVVKIPVVLAEFQLQIHLDSIIELPEYAYEIKTIKKDLKLTQCLLLQNTNVLFIKGFVRKNIEYATRCHSNQEGFCGDIRHCTVDVPFSCATPITFNGIAPIPVINNREEEFGYFRKQDLYGPQFADKDQLLSTDRTEFNKDSTEYFNELPFCEIERNRIVEFDEFINPHRPIGIPLPVGEKRFKEIEEKMVIYLDMKLLQKREVLVPSAAKDDEDGC